MFSPIKVTEISESRIVFENGLYAERDPKQGNDAPIRANRDLIYTMADGFFSAKKRDYYLFLEWRSWCLRDMIRYHKNAKEDDFIYNIGVAM